MWQDQKREKNGRFLSFDGSQSMKKLYTEKEFEDALRIESLRLLKPAITKKVVEHEAKMLTVGTYYTIKDVEAAYRAGLNDHSGILLPSKKVEYYLNKLRVMSHL